MTRCCQCGCGQPVRPGNRFVVGHNTRRRNPYRVDFDTGCWIWTAAKTSLGYGGTTDDDGAWTLAHRLFYERYRGPIPKGFEVHHLCRNPACVNPRHLEALAPEEHRETREMARGERVFGAKLTEAAVRQIRVLFDQGWVLADIGDAFGVNYATVRKIGQRVTWRHVPEAV